MKRISNNMGAIRVFSLFLIVMSLSAGAAIAQSAGGIQATKLVGRLDLTNTPSTVSAGQVKWSVQSKGKPGTVCSLTSDGTITGEIMLQVTDPGGLSGDPVCELALDFDSLKNSFTFSAVTITTLRCANSPCEPMVLRLGSPGSGSLHVTVRGEMKGMPLSDFSIFRVRPILMGPAGFDPFHDQPKPDLIVAKIDKTNLSSPGNSAVVVTLGNLGDADWIERQSFAYGADTSRAVLVSLRKDNVVCGSASLPLNQFDPDRGLNRVNQPVTLTWPGCSFSGTANFTATVDVGNRLFERDETSGKSRTVELRSSIVTRPR